MSDVGAITSQALGQSQTNLSVQIQTSVLKKALEIQKETAQMILEALGVGRNLDVHA